MYDISDEGWDHQDGLREGAEADGFDPTEGEHDGPAPGERPMTDTEFVEFVPFIPAGQPDEPPF
jgi:hypothetical protein